MLLHGLGLEAVLKGMLIQVLFGNMELQAVQIGVGVLIQTFLRDLAL